ncbi:adhesin [Staphylococcus argenteus]|uniref:GA module-containing protein n=1 Tax=Staphylococcus argenteus TaxID=985002 RepID=UPI000B59225F|nr:GA module-containing protein [Staphylococcus argenteus]
MAKYRGKPFRFYVKLSCSAIMVSSVMLTNTMPYFAEAATENDTVSTNDRLAKQDLLDKLEKAKHQIQQLTQLSAETKENYKEQLNQAKSASQIDDILKRAKDIEGKSQKGVSVETDKQKELDKNLDQLLTDLNELTSKVDKGQLNTESKHDVLRNDASTVISNKNEKSNHTDDEVMVDQALADLNHFNQQIHKTDNSESDKSKDASTTATTNHSEFSKEANKGNTGHGILNEVISSGENQSNDNRLTDKLQGSDKINHAMIERLAKSDNQTKHYTFNKLNTLKSLDKRIADTSLSKSQKSDLLNEVDKTKERIKNQRSIILDQLAHTKDKKAATKTILENVFNKDEADKILKNIQLKGQTDQQIADQITRNIDRLSLTTSDDILTTMFEQSKDKKALITQILQTKLGKTEADKLAKEWTNKGLSSEQIVEQLKKHFASTGDTSSDDILKAILNNAKDKKRAIETILATRIEQQKAKLLADLITKMETDQNKILKLVKSALAGKADDLLNLQKRLNQTKKDLDYIFPPILNRPSLLDRLNKSGKSSDLDKLSRLLNQGSNLLDSIPDIPTPKPEKTLTLGKGNGLLSGLLNDDGNVSLPKAGETLKQHWIQLAVVVGGFGVLMIWMSRRKKVKSKA